MFRSCPSYNVCLACNVFLLRPSFTAVLCRTCMGQYLFLCRHRKLRGEQHPQEMNPQGACSPMPYAPRARLRNQQGFQTSGGQYHPRTEPARANTVTTCTRKSLRTPDAPELCRHRSPSAPGHGQNRKLGHTFNPARSLPNDLYRYRRGGSTNTSDPPPRKGDTQGVVWLSSQTRTS